MGGKDHIIKHIAAKATPEYEGARQRKKKKRRSVKLLAMNDHGSGAMSDGSAEQCGPHPSSEFHDVVRIRLHILIDKNGIFKGKTAL